jgi:hydroxymethylbilane synthase
MIRIATRQSPLAMWQAHHVQDLLEKAHPGIEIELVKIVTQGDKILDRPLAKIGGKGLFLKELETALLNDEADIAVHSMKDVPAEMPPGLQLDVVLSRANPYDALVSCKYTSLADLPLGSVVGTSSLRRQSQLLALRPDLKVADLRGNVGTRLGKLDNGYYDAIILACAGLERLDLADRITEQLDGPGWLPAATQGIIGIQRREHDERIRLMIEPLGDADSAIIASAERAVARVLEASCQVPLAAHAILEGGNVSLDAVVASPDGKKMVKASGSAPTSGAIELGEHVANQLLAKGAMDIIQAL